MNEQEFDVEMNNAFIDCSSHLFNGEFYDSKVSAKMAIEICKKIINDIDCSDADLKNKSVVAGILFRGLQDLTELCELTTSRNWMTQPKTVERARISLCNCKERIDYASRYVISNNLINLKNMVQYYEGCFSKRYGSGVYASPEMLIKSVKCSVCGEDFTTCEHISGAIYNGVLCKGIIEEVLPKKRVSIVDKPKDPRCRLWSWNSKKVNASDSDYTIRGAIFSSFKLDDF